VVTALWCNESPPLEGLWGPTFFPSAYQRRDQHPKIKTKIIRLAIYASSFNTIQNTFFVQSQNFSLDNNPSV
jgi:hypothetical protein